MDNDSNEINLEIFGKIAGYVTFIAITYAIFYLFYYYQILFGIPIFQYIELSELVLFAASGVFGYFIIYIFTLLFFLLQVRYPKLHGSAYIVLLILSVVLMVLIVSKNSVSSNSVYQVLLLLVLAVPLWLFLLRGKGGVINPLTTIKLTRNELIYIPFIFVMYFAIVECTMNYFAITKTYSGYNVKLKLKSGEVISTTNNFKLVGRTKSFWFFYLAKQEGVRVLGDSEVLISEFYGTPPPKNTNGALPPTIAPPIP